ncbi:MAG: type II toxin-antitoxin system HicB family antitoxin [Dehalococcoidia bacterium]|nr:type II toxin-antitoxin system HicB family antitoxin [Dehalococcoidia bacterium]
MTKIIYKAEIFPEGDCYVGLCRELDVSSFGDSPEEAGDSLQEAVELFLEGCEELGTLDEVLEESGFQKINGTWELGERITQDKVATVQ